MACNICDAALERIYVLDGKTVNSLSMKDQRRTDVWSCASCGHTLTRPLAGLGEFYANDYTVQNNEEFEDQLVRIENGKDIFRSDLQADSVMQKVAIENGMHVLDFGCAKASTLKKILQRRAIVPFAFDVSEHYRPFWNGIIPQANQAVNDLPQSWHGTLDVVTAFFCLEHVADPLTTLRAQATLLKQGGTLYLVVPNMQKNAADMLVLDHINHFSPSSLQFALGKAGFGDITADASVNDSWLVVTAVRDAAAKAIIPERAAVAAANEASHAIATYWKKATEGIARFTPAGKAPIAIYGAGFYGTYTALHLPPSVDIACFVDQNSFLQGKPHLGRPVVPPAALPEDVQQVLVAINPLHARAAMSNIPAWKDRAISYEFVF